MNAVSTAPADILENERINSRWLGLKKLPEKLLAGGFCYRAMRGKAKAAKDWVKKIRISVCLTVDGRIWARSSEVLIAKYGGAVRHGGWHYSGSIQITEEGIVALTNQWQRDGYMVRIPRNERINAEVVIAALQEHE